MTVGEHESRACPAPRFRWSRPLPRALTLYVACLCASSAVLAEKPYFRGIGDLPGGNFLSAAHAVSRDGKVVVGESQTSSGIYVEAIRWTAEEGIVSLGDFNGPPVYSIAWAVSGDGSAIAGLADGNADGGAFRWTNEGGMECLGNLPGGDVYSEARAISGDGTVVGGASSSGRSGDWYEAFRRSAHDGMSDLGDWPGGGETRMTHGINADGAVLVGNGGNTKTGEAFRWTPSSGLESLGHVKGGMNAIAWAVNSEGTVIVGEDVTSSHGTAYTWPVRWTAETGMVSIGKDQDGNVIEGQAFAVSDDGNTIVGKIAFGGPFIWDPDHGLRSLSKVLKNDYKLDLSEWLLLYATGISGDGRTIVGYGASSNGTEGFVAFLGRPPIPGDTDCSQHVDFDDIDPFVLALTDPGAYEAAYPNCEIETADINADGSIDFNDIDSFVICLMNNGC